VIHPTAIVHPKARVDSSANIGPYAVVDEAVEVGADCKLGPYVYLTGTTVIGPGNIFHAGCTIGDAPQDVKYKNEATWLRIGGQNIFREQVTVHRSAKVDQETVVGSHNFMMANAHVGHNCRVGNHVIIANGALLGGYVSVADRAFISGNCLVHQFVRVGEVALMQGGSAISKDLPPFTVARGSNGMCGLNTVGLRRAGFDAEERLELKELYKFLFRERRRLKDAVMTARGKFKKPACQQMLDFLAESKRGTCADTSIKHKPEELFGD
jgi:UDP-N-acetylglucosamine acyltransferase